MAAANYSPFVKVRSGACTLHVPSDLGHADFLKSLALGEAELGKRYTLERIGSASSSRVFRFRLKISGQDRRVYYKEYMDRSLGDALKHVVRASRARRAFRASMMLNRNGFQAPEIVALGEDRVLLWNRRCFLVTFEAVAALPLYSLLEEDSSILEVELLRRKRALIRTLGKTVGRLHAHGIVHGDLRPGNVLARWEQDHWSVCLLDNERTRKYPWVPPSLRRKNLVQIGMLRTGVSHTDRLRFWRAYLTECPSLYPKRKQWAKRVHTRTVERLKKD